MQILERGWRDTQILRWGDGQTDRKNNTGAGGFPGSSSGKESACQVQEMQEMWVQPLGQGDPLEKETATHSSTLAWRIPWTVEPGVL